MTRATSSRGGGLGRPASRTHLVGAILCLAALLACKQTPPVKRAPELKVSAQQLASDYNANEARGDSLYKGKVIEVDGAIQSIDSDFSDEAVVVLYTGDLLGCSLRGLPKSVAAGLSKDQRVTFVCVGDGESIGAPRLKDCRVP